ncbi:hypothetical protein VNO78_22539 [Psophocarpus tetragonolobus]|uniref:Uncharacterized protein n=1 Tax=Psophocarpus tetragonolobus TaxID=3891 RepID=A0AAN9XC68_PSOTE
MGSRRGEALATTVKLAALEAPKRQDPTGSGTETRWRTAGTGDGNAISATMRFGPISDLRPSLLQIGTQRSKRSPPRRDLGGRCAVKSRWSERSSVEAKISDGICAAENAAVKRRLERARPGGTALKRDLRRDLGGREAMPAAIWASVRDAISDRTARGRCGATGSGPPGGSPVPAGDAAAGRRLDCRRVTAQGLK